jgi:hypothetical protein
LASVPAKRSCRPPPRTCWIERPEARSGVRSGSSAGAVPARGASVDRGGVAPEPTADCGAAVALTTSPAATMTEAAAARDRRARGGGVAVGAQAGSAGTRDGSDGEFRCTSPHSRTGWRPASGGRDVARSLLSQPWASRAAGASIAGGQPGSLDSGRYASLPECTSTRMLAEDGDPRTATLRIPKRPNNETEHASNRVLRPDSIAESDRSTTDRSESFTTFRAILGRSLKIRPSGLDHSAPIAAMLVGRCGVYRSATPHTTRIAPHALPPPSSSPGIVTRCHRNRCRRTFDLL